MSRTLKGPVGCETFSRHPKTRIFIGEQPLLREHIERRHASCERSVIAPSSPSKTIEQIERAFELGFELILSDNGQGPAQSPAPQSHMLQCQTSGSTGLAKYIRRSHGSWMASFSENQKLFSITEHSSYAILGQLHHSLHLYAYCEARQLGADLHILSHLRPNAQAEAIKRQKLSHLYITPTQLMQLLPFGPFLDVKQILCGGGDVSAALLKRTQTEAPNAQFTQFYGASEASFITLTTPKTPEHSVGGTYPHVTLEFRDIKQGIGEIWVKSPYVFSGYTGREDPFTRRDSEGFLWVGEYGTQDKFGHITLKGRRGRMVTICDHNVFLDDLERRLSAHCPCYLIARPDPKRGHHLLAVIQESQPSHEQDIMNAARRLCPPYARPKAVISLPNIPYLSSGKPDYTALSTCIASLDSVRGNADI